MRTSPRLLPGEKKTGVSGKLHTIDTSMVKSVRWPHEFMYTPTAQPVAYKNISSMAFVDGYIIVMTREPLLIKKLMLAHLQELMEDGECYRWPAVRAYHAPWLQ